MSLSQQLRMWLLFSLAPNLYAGDDPPRDRTGELRKHGFPTRHLVPVQMTTDTALGVTKKVVDDKGQLRADNEASLISSP